MVCGTVLFLNNVLCVLVYACLSVQRMTQKNSRWILMKHGMQ